MKYIAWIGLLGCSALVACGNANPNELSSPGHLGTPNNASAAPANDANGGASGAAATPDAAVASDDASTSTSTADGDAGGGGNGNDSGVGGGNGDAGGGGAGDASSASPDPFAGAPAFTSVVAQSTHNAGKDCMGGCHDHGFTFAGTLTDGNGNPVAGAEVRLVDATGAAISVHTGSTGNFHSSTAFTGPAHVAARDATHVATMVTALQPANGGCNGCHATGKMVAPIHLP